MFHIHTKPMKMVLSLHKILQSPYSQKKSIKALEKKVKKLEEKLEKLKKKPMICQKEARRVNLLLLRSFFEKFENNMPYNDKVRADRYQTLFESNQKTLEDVDFKADVKQSIQSIFSKMNEEIHEWPIKAEEVDLSDSPFDAEEKKLIKACFHPYPLNKNSSASIPGLDDVVAESTENTEKAPVSVPSPEKATAAASNDVKHSNASPPAPDTSDT